MSYLNDPRVFFATERTLLAWIRTEVAVLGFTFVIKKFALELADGALSVASLEFIIWFLCLGTCLLSLLSVIQIFFSLRKLGPEEIPTKYSKSFMLFVGIISLLMNVGISMIIIEMSPI
ncbi:YidH family protein [Persicobacter diffluens]|uniref:DUF202 domain-containing protein n=1 Tax=Persicobacter diffluens TaxID=981 RepID=A0AAN4W217_9BACT|nr:hypothetical protein PEDI_39760 [Persicobacter diffluens]